MPQENFGSFCQIFAFLAISAYKSGVLEISPMSSWNLRYHQFCVIKQEAQLPQRDSALATHVILGSLTDRALHWTPHLLYNYTVGHKKRATFIFTITLASVDRFQ